MTEQEPIHIAHFSDVLCVWAYAAQVRLDELKRQYGDRVRLSYHFIPLFGDTAHRVGEGWRDKGGYGAFGDHVRQVCSDFPHVQVHQGVWSDVKPASSAACHHLLKAAQLLEARGEIDAAPLPGCDDRSLFEELAWQARLAFFRDARDIARLDELLDIAAGLGLPVDRLRALMDSGEALAALCRDVELRDEYKVEGSPTYVLSEGRQKLYGNVGYKVIAANVEEVLNRPKDQASWC